MIITSTKKLRESRTDLLLSGMDNLEPKFAPLMRKLIDLTGKLTYFYNDMDSAALFGWLYTPLRLGQYVCITQGQDIVAYTSWAYMNREARERWLAHKKVPKQGDWNSGDEIWGIDAMAIDGRGIDLSRLLRKTLRDLGHSGAYCNYTRRYPNGHFRITRVLI
jgi:hemolysin-activating ACP:hemolysin acyltransferase